MKSHIINCLDLETDGPDGRIIEVGVTTANLDTMQVLSSWSFPVHYIGDNSVLPAVTQLTGWTSQKLEKRGELLCDVVYRLNHSFGAKNRLCVIDHPDELKAFGTINPFLDVINVSSLYKIVHQDYINRSLTDMLETAGLEFTGQRHTARDDSKNIARLFLKLIGGIRKS